MMFRTLNGFAENRISCSTGKFAVYFLEMIFRELFQGRRFKGMDVTTQVSMQSFHRPFIVLIMFLMQCECGTGESK